MAVNTYPGPYAVPGSMQPGAIVPGTPLGGGVLPCTHGWTGETLVYPDFEDIATQETLTIAPPGGSSHLIRPVNWIPGGDEPYYPGNYWDWRVIANG